VKILVLGGAGMAGHVVSLYLREQGFDVDTLSAKSKLDSNTIQVDVTDSAKLIAALQAKPYDVVINCIGMLIQQSEERKDLAAYLNGYLPHQLEQHYKDTKTKVIHLSTDCVFSGHNAPYKEDSPYDGDIFYDRSKALGEIINDKDLTFRMSIVGPDLTEKGVGLFNWFMKQHGEIGGYTHAMWSGITTIELAKGIKAAIDQNLTGLYHLVPSQNISKFDLLNVFQKHIQNDVSIKPNPSLVVDKTLINTRKDFDFDVLSYDDMIKEMKEWITNHQDLYPHYKAL
jgi:dTDP-4-dehydrorhamnose reductase